MNIKITNAHFVLKLQGENRDQLPERIRVEYSSCIAESPQHKSHHDILLPVKPDETLGDLARRIVATIHADATKKPNPETED